MAQTFFPTAAQLINDALIDLGAVDPEGGVTPATAQNTAALRTLNYLLTSWQGHGLQIWCQREGTYALADGTSSFTVGPSGTVNIDRPLEITQAWLRDSTVTPNVDTPVRIIGREEYNRLSAKSTEGVPTALFYDSKFEVANGDNLATVQANKGTIYLYPTPDATVATTYNLYFIYTRPIHDLAATTDLIDLPQVWLNALKWNLALALGPSYEVPERKLERIDRLAERSLALAMSTDREPVSVTISPSKEGAE